MIKSMLASKRVISEKRGQSNGTVWVTRQQGSAWKHDSLNFQPRPLNRAGGKTRLVAEKPFY